MKRYGKPEIERYGKSEIYRYGKLEQKLKKREYLFVGIIILTAMVWFIGSNYFSNKQSGQVQILVDGEPYGTYSLYDSLEIKVETPNGYNVVKISDGVARVTEADCPDLLCVKMHAISTKNQVICCLPHRVVIRVISDQNGEENLVDSETY